jgi:chromate reductase
MTKKSIGILIGSLRKGSFSKSIGRYVGQLLSEKYDIEFVEIGNLAMFNQDFDDEGTTPKEWTAFRAKIKSLDGLLFVTPEYNRSIPPVLKNALDIASRPYGQNCWAGKPAAILGVSPGKIGGALAVQALRVPLAFLNVKLMMQPEAYVGDVAALLDEKGTLTNPSTGKFLASFAAAFDSWMQR